MRLRFTQRSRRHLDAIAEYIAERNPDATRRVGERIREVAALISEFPYIGHEGALAGTREVVVPSLPYIIQPALHHCVSARCRHRFGAWRLSRCTNAAWSREA
jgi:toxin ParE1/3/4